MIPRLCFDVRGCQKLPDRFHYMIAVEPGSWSVDEHDPLAVQLKLVGRSDSVVPSCLQTGPTSIVYELQFQSLESGNRSKRLPSLPWFFHAYAILSH